MSPGVRRLALMAPAAGMVAFLIVALHVWANVKFGHKLNMESDEIHRQLPWKPRARQNMVLLVIAMPTVFIVMAMRGEIRMWAVMTGSAWLPYVKLESQMENPLTNWTEVKTLQLATYTTDLELASTFQYYTVWSFGQLCASYFLRAPLEYRQALTWAGLQGVYFYVLIGVVRSVGDFVVTVLSESKDPGKAFLAQQLQEKVLNQIGPVFTVGTMLCVYNMYIIAKMKDVTDHLGKASLKFQATRVLLLVSQIQLQVLIGITAGSKLQQAIEKLPAPLNQTADYLHLSVYRAKLLHASLLGFECLAVIIVNRFMWDPNDEILFMEDDDDSTKDNGSGYAPLPGEASGKDSKEAV